MVRLREIESKCGISGMCGIQNLSLDFFFSKIQNLLISNIQFSWFSFGVMIENRYKDLGISYLSRGIAFYRAHSNSSKLMLSW